MSNTYYAVVDSNEGDEVYIFGPFDTAYDAPLAVGLVLGIACADEDDGLLWDEQGNWYEVYVLSHFQIERF